MKYTKLYLFILACSISIFGHSQASNMTLMGQYNPTGMPTTPGGTTYNDVWGWEDGAGNEYAILGNVDSIIVLDVTVCSNPVRVNAYYTGLRITWRDFKTYSNYLYAVSEGSGGLLVFDMSTITTAPMAPVATINSPFSAAHNIFVDVPKAKLYAVGNNSGYDSTPNANQFRETISVFDLSTPASPTLLGDARLDIEDGNSGLDYYVHDAYVRNDTVYASHGNLEELIIWDFTNPATPSVIKRINTGNYNHSSWVTDDGAYVYYAEEVPPKLPMGVIDLANLNDGNGTGGLSIVTTFSHSLETGTSTPHNPFVHNGNIYLSNYMDGLKVFNISNPTNPIIFAYYDTYPDNNGMPYPAGGNNYKGNWGTYPFSTSGCLYASDMQYGFHALIIGTPAPVDWNRFEVKNVNNKKADVSWSTLIEENNQHFEIEKSYNGMDYRFVALVPGAGNSEELREYNYLDTELSPGKIYYRIKQVDFDGNYEYSEVRSINIRAEEFVSIFPNPITNDKIRLEIIGEKEQDYQVSVYNVTGQKVSDFTLQYQDTESKTVFEVSLDPLIPAGTYFVKVFNNAGPLLTKQLVKI